VAINARSVAKAHNSPSSGLTSGQKAGLGLLAVLCGPAVIKKLTEQPVDKVDLSSFNMVTHYDTPAVDKMDGTLRIEFCAS